MSSRIVYLSFALASLAAVGACSSQKEHAPAAADISGNQGDGGTATPSPSAVKDAATDLPSTQVVTGDAGAPTLSTSKTVIDFGQVACGQSAGAISFALNNNGQAPFAFSTSFKNGSTSLFSLSPAQGNIPSGSSQTITLTMGTVPSPGNTATDFYADMLTILATGSYGTATEDIPIHLTGKGAILRFSPSAVDFGNVPLNANPTLAFGIVNDGNAPAEINLDSGNKRFSRTPLGPVVIAGGTTVTLQAGFAPTDTTPQSGTLTMVATTSPSNSFCQELPQMGLAMTGAGSNGTAAITPATISFGDSGLVNCGTQASPQPITITNTGTAPFDWTANVTAGAAYYTVNPTKGTVQAKSSQIINVVPGPIPQSSAVTPDLYGGTLNITTTAVNDSTHVVQLHQTARGIVLASTLGGRLDLGNIPLGQTVSSQFSVSNNGNVPTTVSFAKGSAAFSVSSSFVVDPNRSVAPTIGFKPTAQQAYTDTIIMTAPEDAVLCGPVPGNITVSGFGSPPSIPLINTTRNSLDFGKVNCGQTPQSATFTLSNSGATAYDWTTQLNNASASLFTVAPSSGSLDPNQSQLITVSAAKIPYPGDTSANFYGDSLTIKAASTFGTAQQSIPFLVQANGAVLRFSPTALDFGEVPLNSSSVAPFTIVNVGNVVAEVNLASSNANFTRAPLGPLVVTPANPTAVSSTFTAGNTTPQLGTMTMSSTGNPSNTFCDDLPAGLALSGAGSNGVASVSPTSIKFGANGLVDCGTRAATQTLTITNSGSAAFDWNSSLSNGAGYSLSPSLGTVLAHSSQDIQIIPPAVPATSAVTPDLYAASVSITTTAVGDSAHIVQLHQTAHGIILQSSLVGSLDFGAISLGKTASSQFSLTNNGNTSADVSMVVGSAAFSVTPSFTVASNQSVAPQVTFSPTLLQSYTDTVVLTVPSNAVLCSPMPANISLVGQGSTGIDVSPSSIDFGLVNCGSTAAYQDVTISNTGPSMNLTPVLLRGSDTPYTLSNAGTAAIITPGSPLPLARGAQMVIRVTPKRIVIPATTAADGFGDTLRITTDSPGDSPHLVALHETAQGAILAISPTVMQFDVASFTGPYGFGPVTFSNIGNYTTSFSVIIHHSDPATPNHFLLPVAEPSADAGPFLLNLAGGNLIGGGSIVGVMQTPPEGNAFHGTYLRYVRIVPTANALLCADPPLDMPVTVVGLP